MWTKLIMTSEIPNKGGGTKDKINVGLPFYGRSFATATGLNEPHDGADQQVWGVDDGTPQYYNIMARLPSMNRIWDKQVRNTFWTTVAMLYSSHPRRYTNLIRRGQIGRISNRVEPCHLMASMQFAPKRSMQSNMN
jgi:GH18 family chitinase